MTEPIRFKTRRAVTIKGCAEAARLSGHRIIAEMPLMAEFYRKRVNEQLRRDRGAANALGVADAKAKLKMLRWAESWMRGPVETWPFQPDCDVDANRHAYAMNAQLVMIGFALQHLVLAHADHPKFREQWHPRQS